MKLIKSFVPHSRCFGSYFDVIFLMYLVSSGFSFKPTSSCSSSSSSTQFSQEWARRKVVVKHSIKSNVPLLLYICLLCDEVLLPWNFRSPGFEVRAPRAPPNMKKSIFLSYLEFKIYYQIVSLFDMYIDMGEWIARRQDRPSLIIEDPLRAP